jgi:ribulose-phosphate 3-epimerase
MSEIIPAILAPDEATFRARLKIAEALAPCVQLDILDNTLYPFASWCDPEVLKTLNTKAELELHLMVSNPKRWLNDLRSVPSLRRAIWHIEAQVDHAELILLGQDLGIEVGLAIAPNTPLDMIEPFAEMIDEILVLGVEPGKSGQPLIPETIKKAKSTALSWPNVTVGFDGGITLENIGQLRTAGVTRYCAASAIFGAADPRAAYEALVKQS